MSYSYIRNLQTTMVAFDVDVRDKLVVNSSPPSDTTELVLRVIEVNTPQVFPLFVNKVVWNTSMNNTIKKNLINVIFLNIVTYKSVALSGLEKKTLCICFLVT